MSNIQTRKTKSFLQRPEGNVGLAVIFGGITVGGILLYKFLPAIIILLQNTLHAAILGGILFGLVALVMNNKFRTTVSYMFKSAIRAFTGWFVTIDPIGILKNYVDDMDKKIQQVSSNISNLNGNIGSLKRTLSDTEVTMKRSLELASAAKKNSDQSSQTKALLESRKAGRAKESYERLHKIYKKMEMLYRVLCNMREKIKFLREDTADEVKTREADTSMFFKPIKPCQLPKS